MRRCAWLRSLSLRWQALLRHDSVRHPEPMSGQDADGAGWRPGDLVRGTAVREVVGGKGNNVARALKRLGRTARPVTFLGGAVGERCAELLRRDDGLDPIIVSTDAPTRVILTVLTESTTDQTAFFDPDPTITPSEAESLTEQVEQALVDAGCLGTDALGIEPFAGHSRGLQRPDLAGPGAEDPGLPGHLRPCAGRDLGLLADRAPGQSQGSRGTAPQAER